MLGDRVAVGRGVGRTFYGWAIIAVKDAEKNGRRVAASPLPCNPYHSDIVLPDSAAENREEQMCHAQELADISRWRGRPDSTTIDE